MSAEAAILLQHLSVRLEKYGGFALIADYGHDGTKTDTFRAFRKHKLHDPLVEPGTADLTADVDFSQIRTRVHAKVKTCGPIPQADFLKNMAIDVRLQRLLASCKPEECESLVSGYNMLMSPKQMGERFKFFAMYPLVLSDLLVKHPPAGFTKAT